MRWGKFRRTCCVQTPPRPNSLSAVADFELIGSTTRSGIAVDEIRFDVAGAPAASGYLLGRHTEGPQPIVIALHDERGDKATLLPDLEHLAARGFLCLSIDSPVTRRAVAARDPLAAFTSQFWVAVTALNLLQADPDADERRSAFLGRGIGGEVAASVAAHTGRVQVVAAAAALPQRSHFIEQSPHALAAGLRLFHDDESLAEQVDGLLPNRLVKQLEAATTTHWLLQIADDDDRLSDEDHALLSLSIPRTVRVEHVAHARDLWALQARRARIDFITQMCG